MPRTGITGLPSRSGSIAARTGAVSRRRKRPPVLGDARQPGLRQLLGTGEAEEVAGLLLNGGWPRDQGEGLLGGDGGHQGVSGEGGEIVEKGSEAVDRQGGPFVAWCWVEL